MIVKMGLSPTSVDFHCGHLCVIREVANYLSQVDGKAVFVIADAQCEDVFINKSILGNRFTEKVSRFMDGKKFEVKFSSDWMGELTFNRLLDIFGNVDMNILMKKTKEQTLKRVLRRLMFVYDSIYLQPDMEIGGEDQEFNFSLTRLVQEMIGTKKYSFLLVQNLLGTDGTLKMSTSAHNTIKVVDTIEELVNETKDLSYEMIIYYLREVCLLNDQQIGKSNKCFMSNKIDKWRNILISELAKVFKIC